MTDGMLARVRVLVVEDEMLLLMMIEGMLEDMGCQAVSSAATVKQALALIDEQAFDVAMLDLNLDGDRSYAVADALAARGVPFLFSTGYGSQGVMDGYQERPVLMKPYQFEQWVLALQQLIPGDGLLPKVA
ncbi:MAG: response regulator [Afipia sp.]|nr:response regulator [Afipia sp.]